MADKKDESPILKLNWFDRTVGFFSPRALLKRKKYKIYNAYLARKFEGADAGRRTKNWNTNNASANTETAIGLNLVRNRSRDLVRNNPYGARGIQVITNNVVGKGITTQIKVDDNRKTDRREKRLNNIWRAWAGTTACDFEGIHDFFGIQRLVMRAVVESGEVLVRIRRVGRQNAIGPDGIEREVPPIQLQVLEADFLATTRVFTRLQNGNVIIQGVELDPQGKVVAYHIFQDHPGSLDPMPGSRFKTIRIPGNEILHVYRMDRPGQIRGVPWLAPIMLRLRDFDLYEDAQLKRQQCAAMFTAFVHDIEGVDDDEETKEEIELGEKMEPGMIEILPPGKDITLSDPPGADNYGEYTSVVLHSIAAGLGITFESLTGNLKQLSFSGGRLGFLEMNRNIEAWRSNIMLSKFMRPGFQWFVNGLDLIGENVSSIKGVFTPPRREMIDPTREVPALKTAIRSGIKTLSSVIRESGADPDTHFEEMAADNAVLDSLGLILDSDPRRVNNGGSFNETKNETENETENG